MSQLAVTENSIPAMGRPYPFKVAGGMADLVLPMEATASAKLTALTPEGTPAVGVKFRISPRVIILNWEVAPFGPIWSNPWDRLFQGPSGGAVQRIEETMHTAVSDENGLVEFTGLQSWVNRFAALDDVYRAPVRREMMGDFEQQSNLELAPGAKTEMTVQLETREL